MRLAVIYHIPKLHLVRSTIIPPNEVYTVCGIFGKVFGSYKGDHHDFVRNTLKCEKCLDRYVKWRLGE